MAYGTDMTQSLRGVFIPLWLITRSEVGHGAKLLYVLLAQKAGVKGVARAFIPALAIELGDDEAQIYRHLNELESCFLDTAIRRFSYAHERHRLEDKIVDLLIAAEALFLSDYKKDDPYIGEIRYRLSLRAAVFLGSDGESRRRIFRQMRAAYDLRSSVVHGSEAEKVKLPKQPNGSPTQLEDFVWAIQELVRVALHKAISLALRPETPAALVT